MPTSDTDSSMDSQSSALSTDSIMLDLVRGQARLEAHFDALMQREQQRIDELVRIEVRGDQTHDNLVRARQALELRVDDLEGWRDKVKGGVVGVGLGAGALGGGIVAIVQNLVGG